ncbi:hypothetical protein KAFR_0L00440 [Kazachstania africana CBS 2517]|uniref:Transcription initiation factor TFIID subunit 4 n=1 Tax=Kazachstania africana (strain ATCC 22294 / BCRC 22015 / CBS 2517 / CECT 1963 / NBRC 1671 / NRRL Y-8276) TaxID=1071382 RepID=H2B201_KAZAF|nr:hypothetical protein KAFR_0L00440 [Kazachstania africana CBS 2517]CCF60651.1 hypothetical protein KAFR_0L00440 [Kazachstania africana CBS 2517]
MPESPAKRSGEPTEEAAEKKRKLSNNDESDSESSVIPSTGSGLALPKLDERKKSAKKAASTTSSVKPPTQTDPSKMQDVLFSAGVDVKAEEALLNSSVTAARSSSQSQAKVPPHPPFLHPTQLSTFMKKIVRDQNFLIDSNFEKNPALLNMISSSCEMYIKDIITNSLIISRHRRKGVQINTGRRSEISVALRAVALQQKKEEERRLKKRIALGLEKEDLENKIDSEETLHRASNVTAGLRAGSKKQYGWLTSSVNKAAATPLSSAGKVATDIATRGDMGLRFREAREEPGIVMRDLLFALENRRIGVHNVISKGYARIRD